MRECRYGAHIGHKQIFLIFSLSRMGGITQSEERSQLETELKPTQVQPNPVAGGGFLKSVIKSSALSQKNSVFPCNFQSSPSVFNTRDFLQAVAGAVQAFLIRKRGKEVFNCLFVFFPLISICYKCFI